MKKILIFLYSIAIFGKLQAQTNDVIYSEQDLKIFESVINKIVAETKSPEYSDLVAETGMCFLGTPYVGHTLEGENEILVINLRELDCTTYLENVVTLAILAKHGKTDFESYIKQLKNLRYRNGEVDGYGSRIHYTSDWIVTNEARGFVKNVTKEIGGEPHTKTINFMTKNRDKYPRLADEKTFEQIKQAEENINKYEHYYIPKSKIADIESNIENGDLIAITCTTDGLDITHVGLAIRQNGRVHFMHAPMSGEKVMISAEPLHNYLAKYKNHTGIMVTRVVY
jgi:hypothetical protein